MADPQLVGSSTRGPAPLSWKSRFLLSGVGATVGLILIVVTLEFVPLGQKGTEFSSIDDIRSAMVSGTEETGPTDPAAGPVSLRQIVTPDSDDRLIYTLRPNLDLRFVRANVRTNQCGMRSPEKPPGVFRIALLGDSFAFGWGVEQGQTFAQRLEDNLNAAARGKRRFEVLNFGVPGYSTFQEVALFENKALLFQPDAVIVYFVQNDFGMPFFVRDLSGGNGILSSLEFVRLGRRLLDPKGMDEKIRKLGLDPNTALERLAAVTKQHGIRLYLAVNPHKKWRQDISHLRIVRTDPSITVMSLREPLMSLIRRRKIQEKDLTLSYDPHPSPLRHGLLGDIMTPYFFGEL
jgi:GDSL-like Lipase/Acylhydrolase family